MMPLSFLELVRIEVASLGLPVVIAGDSAGGGLALTIAQQSSWQQMTKRLILIAPWVDSEWNYEDFERYENRDPWLLSQSLRYIAIVWSNRGDYKRVEVSPSEVRCVVSRQHLFMSATTTCSIKTRSR
jgi:acetyl esterase/lipase